MSPQPDLTILPGGRADVMAWRALGQLVDLDLVFDAADRPQAVTHVLHACAEPAVATAEIWRLSLAARIGGLLAIWSAGQGARTLELGLTCPSSDCGSALEVNVPVAALLELARAAEATPELPGPVTLRRPCGTDQRRWRSAAMRDVEAEILASLVVSGTMPETTSARAELEEALAEFDPLPCFSVAIRCPDCDGEADIPVDLEAEMLARLARVQARLFRQVDTLACRYGWSDEAILVMPPARRARYMDMAKAEGRP